MTSIKSMTGFIAAAAIAAAPGIAFATPGSSQGSMNGTGWNHFNGPPAGQTGQPFADCEELVASGEGATPGNASSAPGSAFNPDGVGGMHYAGEQPQNSRNSASVSQYDSACAHQTG